LNHSHGRKLLVGLGLLACVACVQGSPPTDPAVAPWSGDFSYGAYAVGFRVVDLRRPGPEGDREITLSVWYPVPAGSTTGEDLQIADYLRSVLREGQLSETDGLAEAPAFVAAMTGSADALSPERARRGLEERVAARSGAEPATGAFPVALWSSRHTTVLAQAPLSEVLASHGFVVATAWSSDPPLAFLWEERSAEEKLATIQAHTGDLTHALGALREDPMVDGQNVVVLSWSYGGQTAARVQESEPAVRGVIAMDANVLPARPEESLVLNRPLLYLVGRDTSGRGFDGLRGLTSTWVAVRFRELAHGNFNALEGYLPALLGTDTVYSWSRGGPVARDGYRSLVRLVTLSSQSMIRNDGSVAEIVAGALRAEANSGTVEILSPDR